ncbi:MAG: hypothetical protein ACJAU1_001738 [Psychromonas sp.]|jgi:hypothetical protein
MKNRALLWPASVTITLVLLAILVYQWKLMNSYSPVSTELTDWDEVNTSLSDYLVHKGTLDHPGYLEIKTGLFIQSLKFSSASDVQVTGIIWQHFENGIHDNIKPAKDSNQVGFVFPEQVDSGNDLEPRQIYRQVKDGIETIGWYFEATLRQGFKYDLYPFDHKTVWIRLWSSDFNSNVVLTPDLASYDSTATDALFGIEEDIVLGNWIRENTFFDYTYSSYSTNFGLGNVVRLKKLPELRFNVVLKRRFDNAFIVYLLPLFLVAILLFSALLTVSDKPNRIQLLGFSVSQFIGGASALFFVILLAHIQLREQFSSSTIVYLERFYILMYCYLVLVTANVYCFVIRAPKFMSFLWYEENLIIKLLYWPVLILAMILISGWVLYLFG